MTDRYTLIQSGDPDDAENVDAMLGHPALVGYIHPDEQYEVTNLDATNGEFTVSSGKSYHPLQTASTSDGKERNRLMVACEHPGGTYDIETVDGANYVWLDPQIGTTDSPQFVVGDSVSDIPGRGSIYLFSLEASDTDDDTVAETLTLTEYSSAYKGPGLVANTLETTDVPGTGNEPKLINGIDLQDTLITGDFLNSHIHRSVDPSSLNTGERAYTKFSAGDNTGAATSTLKTGLEKTNSGTVPNTVAARRFAVVGDPTDDIGDSGLTVIGNPISGQGGASIIEEENDNIIVSSGVGDQDIVIASASSGKVIFGNSSTGDIEIGDNSSGNIKAFVDIVDSSDNTILDESAGQIVRGAVEADKITEEVTPSSVGDSVSPSVNTETFIVNPNGRSTVDLSGAGREGRELTVKHNGGSNDPSVQFNDADFGVGAPNALSSTDETVTVQYISGSWDVISAPAESLNIATNSISSNATITPPASTELYFVGTSNDSTATIDLGASDAPAGRQLLVEYDTKTGTGSVTFQSGDFTGSTPSDLTAKGSNATVVKIGDANWTLQTEST